MKILAATIIEEYGTNNPYEIASKNQIMIVCEPLGNIHGYYNKTMGQKFIHVNDNLPSYFQRHVIAHLLYRVFTNPEEMMFIKKKHSLHFTEDERKANIFAMNLSFYYKDFDGDFSRYHMSESDVEDLFRRLDPIWNADESYMKEKDNANKILYVIKKLHEME